MTGVLAEGEQILLIDKVGRRYRVRLKAGGRHSMHSGLIEHDELIGRPEGVIVTTQMGARLLAVRPTFAEQVVGRRRQAQPIYPKDLGAILIGADIHPGARVLEAGTGTGALTLAVLRAVGPEGLVVSYELRALDGSALPAFSAVLTKDEHVASRSMMICCSGSKCERLVLDL